MLSVVLSFLVIFGIHFAFRLLLAVLDKKYNPKKEEAKDQKSSAEIDEQKKVIEDLKRESEELDSVKDFVKHSKVNRRVIEEEKKLKSIEEKENDQQQGVEPEAEETNQVLKYLKLALENSKFLMLPFYLLLSKY